VGCEAPGHVGDPSPQAVGVTATVSLLSLMLWTWVLGPLGALLALPATLLAKSLLIDPDPQLLWLNAYIAADPDDVDAPPPAESAAAESAPAESAPAGVGAPAAAIAPGGAGTAAAAIAFEATVVDHRAPTD